MNEETALLLTLLDSIDSIDLTPLGAFTARRIRRACFALRVLQPEQTLEQEFKQVVRTHVQKSVNDAQVEWIVHLSDVIELQRQSIDELKDRISQLEREKS